jgi:long-chain acyl-CoA synthetase
MQKSLRHTTPGSDLHESLGPRVLQLHHQHFNTRRFNKMGAVVSLLVGLLTAVGFAKGKRGMSTVPAPNAPSIQGQTKPRRSVKSPSPNELTTTPGPDVRTATDIIQYASKNYGNRELIGSRSLVKVHSEEKTLMKDGKETKKTWQYFEMSDYKWLSAGEFGQIVGEIGSGIASLRYTAGDICILFAGTSSDWLSMALGCWHRGLTIATAYDTLGVSGLAFAVTETEGKMLFTNAELLGVVEKAIGQAPTLETVIYNGQVDPDIVARFAKTLPQIRLLSMDELRAKGRANPVASANPDPETTACIMYTSGSTGNPKGVVITHANIVAAVSGAVHILDSVCKRDGTDTFLAMLPQAHILELTVELTCLSYGVRLGYGSPRTLLSTSCRNCEGDLATLKPTIMAGVPAVWDGIRKAIMSTTTKLPPTARKVFDLAFKLKWFLLQNGLPGVGILDAAVFNKIKAQFGGNLVAALVGGAPLSQDAQQFISVALCPLISGYGSTECMYNHDGEANLRRHGSHCGGNSKNQ